jgi:hypothetical protein
MECKLPSKAEVGILILENIKSFSTKGLTKISVAIRVVGLESQKKKQLSNRNNKIDKARGIRKSRKVNFQQEKK